MYKLLLCIIMYFVCNACYGQSLLYSVKPPIDTSAFGRWDYVSQTPSFSNYGNYVAYDISRANRSFDENIYVVRSIDDKLKFEYTNGYRGVFSDDEKYYVFKTTGDSLCILDLQSLSKEYIRNVSSYEFEQLNQTEWLEYQQTDSKQLVFYNIETKKVRRFDNVSDHFFLNGNKKLILLSNELINGMWINSISIIDLASWNKKEIWAGKESDEVGIFRLNTNKTQFAFVQKSKRNDQEKSSIWIYATGTPKAEQVFDDSVYYMHDSLQLNDVYGFSGNDNKLFFTLKKKLPEYHPDSDKVKLDVWSYFDPELQTMQLSKLVTKQFTVFHAVIDLPTKHSTMLGKGDDNVVRSFSSVDYGNDYIVVWRRNAGDYETEWKWNKAARVSIILISTKDGSEKILNDGLVQMAGISYKFTPDEKFLFWYDADKKNYFSYEIATSKVRNLTGNLHSNWTNYFKRDVPRENYYGIPDIGGFVNDGEDVLIYDQADLWQIDVSGKKAPLSLTKGYGIQHNIAFTLLNTYDGKPIPLGYKTYKDGDAVILTSYDRNTKDNGFYKIVIGKSAFPKLLSSEPYIICGTTEGEWNVYRWAIKAFKANKYIVIKERASESPNLFYTEDFKTYKQLSFVYPEKAFNWLTTELVNYTTLDGKPCQGILYKPESFNPEKKYPVIFYYYEQLSDELNQYLIPNMSTGQLNISYFVSNGYMVFVPDVHYTIGDWGGSAYNSIVAAANKLKSMPFIDVHKMGLQGHSRGGYETDYIVTHSHLFAAAMSASGWADIVYNYNAIKMLNGKLGKYGGQSAFETGYQRMGKMLWEIPEQYIRNSPIFYADHVTTPLLMMNNRQDDDITFNYGIELFTALRRLGKRVWMLQYDNEGHALNGSRAAAMDFTTRIKQFFDHYLMDKPAPKWMVEGIPAAKKGIDDGLELGQPGVEPPRNLLIPEQQKIVDSLTNAPRFLMPKQ